MSATDYLAFKRMLVELSENITEVELESIKFMCDKKIPRRHLETVKSAVKLWEALEERTLIAPGNLEFLKDILRHSGGGRTDLLGIVDRFAASQVNVMERQCIHCQETLPDMSDEFDLISSEIGKDWRRMVRKLGTCDSDIDTVLEQYPRDVREQIQQLLVLWQKKFGPEASRADIVEALRKCQRNTLATKLEQM